MQDFRKLQVWQRSHELTLEIFKLTRSFPKEEMYGLTSQLRRAVVSVELNLAEGAGRGSDQDFRRFIHMAIGSASETECLLLIGRDLKLVSETDFSETDSRCSTIKRMLLALRKKLTANGPEQ